MAYDEALAARVRDLLADSEAAPDLREQKMFGGIGFLLAGNICVGVHGDSLIVRLPHEDADAALDLPHVRPFDITGRPMHGWLFVAPDGLRTKRALAAWVERGRAFASTLPPK
jgi:hypothetical protein